MITMKLSDRHESRRKKGRFRLNRVARLGTMVAQGEITEGSREFRCPSLRNAEGLESTATAPEAIASHSFLDCSNSCNYLEAFM